MGARQARRRVHSLMFAGQQDCDKRRMGDLLPRSIRPYRRPCTKLQESKPIDGRYDAESVDADLQL